MKKLIDPQELRRSSLAASPEKGEGLGVKVSRESLDESDDLIDFQDFFKKALRHKKVIFLMFVILYPLFICFYSIRGTWYEKKTTVNVNNAKNNAFFKYIDSSLGVDDNSQSDDLLGYSSKAMTSLSSDDFLEFCYKSALNDPEIAKIFEIDLKKSLGLDKNTKNKLKSFFQTTMVVAPFEKSIASTKDKAGFIINSKNKEQSFLENSPEKIAKLMNEYLIKLNSEDLNSAKKLLKDKVENIQKQLAQKNAEKFKVSQSIPLVDKDSVYQIQRQIQASKLAISGNKALETQFQDRLTDIEKKIASVRDVGNVEGDAYALGQELTSLSNQKSQLNAQGLEKESFLYKNISESLNKTLKALEDNQKISLGNNQKNDVMSFYSKKAFELNKVLDEVTSFLSKKTETKALATQLDNSLSINFPENTNQNQNQNISSSAPLLDPKSASDILTQLQSVKKVLEGNQFFDESLKNKVEAVEKKIVSLTRNTLEDKSYSNYIQDISNMAYLQNQLKLQGVDEDSVIAKRISENLKKATKELQDKKNISLKDLKIDDFYTPDESAVYSQKLTLEKIKGENTFYEAKISELSKSLDELTFLLNDRATKEDQIAELENSIKNDNKTLDLLNASLLKMDLSDLKALKRLEFSFEPIQEKSILPLVPFVLLSLVLSFVGALAVAYLREVTNPLLETIKALEELGNSVLGGVPSTNNNLLQQDGSQLDGLTDLSYLRMGISLENMFSSLKGKVVLFTSSENSLKSAIISLNLGAFFGSTGKKILILESDLTNNSIQKMTGAPLNGGVSELYQHKEQVNIYPFKVNEGLDVITGDPLKVPSVYRLASQNLKDLLSELSLQYDYIFLHTRPCLEAPDASDLSRYAEVGIVCCDANSMNIRKLEKINQEMKAFLSKETCFILENAKDIEVGIRTTLEPKKVAA